MNLPPTTSTPEPESPRAGAVAALEVRVADLERQLGTLRAEMWVAIGVGDGSHAQPLQSTVQPFAQPQQPQQPYQPYQPYRPPAQSALQIDRVPSRRDIEELLGGRLLALVGGAAVLVGLAFFVVLAVSHGWIGETTRTVFAAAGSAALFGLGVWLYERRGQTQAALAAVGTGIAGAFCSLAVATSLYHLLPLPAALPIAFGIGAVATATALRWNSRTVAGLGIGGTLCVPLLGQVITTGGMVFLAVATASAVAVLVWRRWAWLSVGALALTLAQVGLWTSRGPGESTLIAVLSTFALLGLAVGLGYELRDRSVALSPVAVVLVPASAAVLGVYGFFGLPHASGQPAGGLWLAGLAIAHIAFAGVALVARRASLEIALVLVATAVAVGDVSAALLGSDWPLALGWVASALGIAWLARVLPRFGSLAVPLLGAQLLLAVGHALVFDAPPTLFASGARSGAGPSLVLVAIAVAAATCARVANVEPVEFTMAFDAVSLAALSYLAAALLDGTPLVIAYTVLAIALAGLASRLERPSERTVAAWGALGNLALVALHALQFDVPPGSLLVGVPGVAEAVVALLGVALGCVCCRGLDVGLRSLREPLLATAAASVLYLGSVLIVSAFQPPAGAMTVGAVTVGLVSGPRQEGQALLSIFWAVCGGLALFAGLRLRRRSLRLGGFGLLVLAALKVFAVDLSALGSLSRVCSFIALGLLLLASAYAYQRLHERTPLA